MAGGERAHSARALRGLFRDTLRALNEVHDIVHLEPEIMASMQDISAFVARPAALVVLGTSAAARARLLHCLLGRRLLPDNLPRGCKWLRVQYGSTTQVRLTLGNSEFELVEELESNKRPWETLPVEDLIRQDHIDLATMLEVELNSPFFLKHGIPIIIPPDIDSAPPCSNLQTLKQKHSELYAKRDLILKNYNPVYICAVDKIGVNIFSDNFMPNSFGKTRSVEDFWNLFNFYHANQSSGDVEGDGDEVDGEQCDGGDKCVNVDGEVGRLSWKARGGLAVFNSESCLDLHQVKDINPHAQIMFVLFSDSRPVLEEKRRKVSVSEEATESTEDNWYSAEDLPESDQELLKDGVRGHTKETPEPKKITISSRRLKEKQISFMNELLDQWELMSPPSPKHHVKSQSLIVDDNEILQNMEQRHLAAHIGNATEHPKSKRAGDSDCPGKSRTAISSVIKFSSECRQSYLLQYCNKLSEVHLKLLQHFILASFDMARELQVVPRKIQYVATQEKQLYEAINAKFSEGEKKQELLQIMQDVLKEMKAEVHNMDWSVDDLPWHRDRRFHDSSVSWPHVSRLFSVSGRSDMSGSLHLSDISCVSDDSSALSDGEEAVTCESYNFDEYDIILNDFRSGSESLKAKPEPEVCPDVPSQIGSIRIENESDAPSMWGTLYQSTWGGTATDMCTNSRNISLKQASLDVQQTVLSKLSQMISVKLVKFVDCLKDTYFGTLQRCLDSLESSCKRELGGRPASEAMRQLLSVAKQVDLQPCASFSVFRSMMESLRMLFHKLKFAGAAEDACCVLSPVWRRQVALTAAASLSPQRLARVISAQILERLREAHEKYQSALTSLESALTNRLHHAQDNKLAIRKTYAPSFARLCLESTSLCDLLMHGTPELGREIGRGQYGVVYAVKGGWGGHSNVAVKSVLPADKRHYHELAMEFFYTRSIPAHPRIVRLYGSIVQRHSGAGPSVLLLTERRTRDLHCAVRQGLCFSTRLRISCDIVEGIRYLHSFGLVHRDIKMKNVLLDAQDRASLSDLGFCAAEALITGSIVGTPVHMAPELLGREYDASVDVYAFGILFWYVCAGTTVLPSAFESLQNKEQLWNKVKKGLRPERFHHFSDECWEIMESCWASDPAQRAHLGDIQPKLERIYKDSLRSGYDIRPCVERDWDHNTLSDDEFASLQTPE